MKTQGQLSLSCHEKNIEGVRGRLVNLPLEGMNSQISEGFQEQLPIMTGWGKSSLQPSISKMFESSERIDAS